MKNLKLFFFSLILTLGVAAQDNNKEQLTVPLTEPGKPFKLSIDLINGSIIVTGYDGKDILVDAEADKDNDKGESRNPSSNGMRRLNSRSLTVIADVKNNSVNIHTEDPNKVVRLMLKIPKGAESIKLATVNDGDIEVSNTGGEMEITNTNGAIRLTNISGSVVANTLNGDVIATFTSVDAKAPMAFSTLNGNVDVTFPASLKANVKLKSDQGEIYTDFDVVVDRSQAEMEKTKDGNMYRLSVKDWVRGKIAGGGPEIMMNNMNGNIYARRSK